MFNFFKRKQPKTTESISCGVKKLSPIEELAVATTLIPTKLTDNDSFLKSNDLTKCDTILFSAFVIRAVMINCASSRENALNFSHTYVSKIISETKRLYPSIAKTFDQMFDSRMEFYDEIYMSKQGFEKSLSAIAEEFEYIILSDLLNKKFVPFRSDSPLPILGFMENMLCSVQVKDFVNKLPALVSPHYQQVQEIL